MQIRRGRGWYVTSPPRWTSERSAQTIVSELIEVGYVIKEKHGRRNRYQIQEQSPGRESAGPGQTIGEILDVLVKARRTADVAPRLSTGRSMLSRVRQHLSRSRPRHNFSRRPRPRTVSSPS